MCKHPHIGWLSQIVSMCIVSTVTTNIKFCLKLRHLSAESIQTIKKAFKDDSVSRAQIKF